MTQQIDIGTGAIRLTDYLPPADIITEYVLGAVVAFVVVQHLKARARRHGNHLSNMDMGFYAALVAAFAIGLQLWAVYDYPLKRVIAYAVQGGFLAPLTITVLLWLLGRVAPELRTCLKQDRRRRHEPALAAQERRSDDTTRYI